MRRVNLANEHYIYMLDMQDYPEGSTPPMPGDYGMSATGQVFIFGGSMWRLLTNEDPPLSLAEPRVSAASKVLNGIAKFVGIKA